MTVDAAHPDPIEVRACAAAGWRVVAASVIGPAHAAAGGRREDSFAIRIIGDCALAVLCDGAGTARRAAEGATSFSASVLCELESAVAGCGNLSATRFRDAVVTGVELCRAAILAKGASLREHHATMLAVAATGRETFVAHVGDGLVGVAAAGDWAGAVMSDPRNGEFANETFFVTEENWSENLRCATAPAITPAGAAVALTDGAMPFVVGPGAVGLEPDFMEPVSTFLRARDGVSAAEALAGTLDSRDARRISGDDKTLVWIGRDAG